MFTFVIRPGYKTKELLIEFRLGSGEDEMIQALKESLAAINAQLVEKIDLWQNDELIFKMNSDCGQFEISSNNYGSMFIHAPDNQIAIQTIGQALSKSPLFTEVVVDHAQYA